MQHYVTATKDIEQELNRLLNEKFLSQLREATRKKN